VVGAGLVGPWPWFSKGNSQNNHGSPSDEPDA
jgi:hypothetical protein